MFTSASSRAVPSGQEPSQASNPSAPPTLFSLVQLGAATVLGSALILGVSATLANVLQTPGASLDGALPPHVGSDATSQPQQRPREWREARRTDDRPLTTS
ncbi:hypothetical protein [Chitinimonas naiadis]